MLGGALRRRARSVLVTTLAAAVVVLAMLAGSASAYDPEYYDDPAYAAALASMAAGSGTYSGASLEVGMNAGGGYASASQAPTIRGTLAKARWAAKVLPAARTLGTIGLGVAAFDIGWKIGRTLDTKFLHLSDLYTEEVGFADTYGLVRDSSPWEWRWTASANEWRLNVASQYGYPCGELETIPSTFPGTLIDLYGIDRSTCKQFLLDAFVSLSSVVGTVGTTQSVTCPSLFFGSSYTGTPAACYRITASEASMEDYLASKVNAFADWSGQSYNRLTSGYDPSYSAQGFASQAAQNAAFAGVLNAAASDSPREFVDHALNPTGTVPNPLIDFQIPDCYGMTVGDCQSAITASAAAADADVSFTVTTADSPDVSVARDLILSTVPAASSLARPEVVTLAKNHPSGPNAACSSTTDNPHWSGPGNTVVAKGNITCNYSGIANYQMTLWRCDEPPSADADELAAGAWGCSIAAATGPSQRSVVANQIAVVYCPPVGGQLVPKDLDAYWIATTVLSNPSPIVNGPPSWSADGWQLPE